MTSALAPWGQLESKRKRPWWPEGAREGTPGSDSTHLLQCLNPCLITALGRVSAWTFPGMGNTLSPRANDSIWTTPFDTRFFLLSRSRPASLYFPPADPISECSLRSEIEQVVSIGHLLKAVSIPPKSPGLQLEPSQCFRPIPRLVGFQPFPGPGAEPWRSHSLPLLRL